MGPINREQEMGFIPLNRPKTEQEWKMFEFWWNNCTQLKILGISVDMSDPARPIFEISHVASLTNL